MSTHEDEDAEVHTQVDLQMDVDGQTEPEHLSYDEAEDAQTEEADQTQKEEDEGHDTRKEVKDGGVDAEVEKQGKGRSKPKREPPELKREPGKSVFPFSRVQKIMKADKVHSFLLCYVSMLCNNDGIVRITGSSGRIARGRLPHIAGNGGIYCTDCTGEPDVCGERE